MSEVFICKSSELNESECVTVQCENIEYFAIKKNGRIEAYLNRCPHIGAPLQFSENQFLTIDKSLIQCAMHGALFQINDGHCISGPCVGQNLEKIDVKETEGKAFLLL